MNAQFPNSGSGPGEFFLPTGLAVDGQGNVWIADTGNGRLQLRYLTIAPPPDAPDAPPDDGTPA